MRIAYEGVTYASLSPDAWYALDVLSGQAPHKADVVWRKSEVVSLRGTSTIQATFYFELTILGLSAKIPLVAN
jgi:hypothetical protein